MKFGLLQLNMTVGDLEGNAFRIAEAVREASARGAEFCVASELCLTGYPPRDLLLVPAFVERSWQVAEALAAELAGLPPVLVGLADVNETGVGKPLFNCAALLHKGGIAARFHKSLLPTYDVFDEDRYFQGGDCPGLIEYGGLKIGVTICEDIWNDKGFWKKRLYRSDPVEKLTAEGVDLLVNLSASPFSTGKHARRREMIGALARHYGLPVLYANQVGGNDDLVFDGRSLAFDASGNITAQGKPFEEDILILDHAISGPTACDDLVREAEAFHALVLGTRDYLRKCGFSKAIIGLSGGIDSSLTAVVASEALGPENVLGVLMPSPFSSRGSIDDSLALARNTGIKTLTIPIGDLMATYDQALDEPFRGLPKDVTEENIQARIRGNLLMALSNKHHAMVLSTGNKSELAVGYCTIYGDMSGGLAVISDVPKTMVYSLCHWLNAQRGTEVVPTTVLLKPPSAELRPGQKDEDSLPPYDTLDAILHQLVELNRSSEEIAAEGLPRGTVEKVARLVRLAEFKRRQAAPGIKITDRAFGTGWRMPIAGRFML